MLKKLGIISVLSILAFTSIACTSTSEKNQASSSYRDQKDVGVNYGTALVANRYKSMEEMIYDADLVAEVEPTGKTQIKDYQGVKYVVTELKVIRALHGSENLKSDIITVFSLELFSGDLFNHEIVFLDIVEPEFQMSDFVVTGAYQGRFRIEDGKVMYDADKYGGEIYFQNEVKGMDLASFEKRIQQAAQNATPLAKPQSTLSIEEQNKIDEQQMLEGNKAMEESKRKRQAELEKKKQQQDETKQQEVKQP
ncbi:hypothetical protein [Paenibacillus agilis]|uniref:Lipoprotein n=1 Tax=Paenibacillus agilis TaxID=3020863 RepID=A0A559J1G3_9BACL|nr:hypothetical protein [Paenibacillus agilis]TVX93730.1 hypothetical protein FPZ44_12075 [Paenibacillus agilis]